MKSLEGKLATALETSTFVRSIEGWQTDENCQVLLRVLNGLIADYKRVLKKNKLTEESYWDCRSNLAIAEAALEEHLATSTELEGFHCDDIPTTLDQLVLVLLCQAISQFNESMQLGRAKSFRPCSDEELKAIASIAPKART